MLLAAHIRGEKKKRDALGAAQRQVIRRQLMHSGPAGGEVWRMLGFAAPPTMPLSGAVATEAELAVTEASGSHTLSDSSGLSALPQAAAEDAELPPALPRMPRQKRKLDGSSVICQPLCGVIQKKAASEPAVGLQLSDSGIDGGCCSGTAQ